MTVQLLLLRHAKSSHDVEDSSDHERALNKRGQDAALSMAAYLNREGLKPELVLCSTATRTRQTLEPILNIWPDLPVRYEEGLYLAPVDNVVGLLHQADREKRLLVIGHHPTMEGMVHHLIDRKRENSEHDLADLTRKYPTAALAVVELDISSWKDVSESCGHLSRFVKPKDLDENGC